ncbi:prosaposin-like [Dioscorea cayenensis subsp. rotundata]|uniref:Prosaposin-like n=1 Tax=Dioscorea cayennensis subsp. rotundata TaxID=55577 RepID=A0AB40BP04_DIOCR|nr:prosaposin-like [Dioscorea cayenensis subsp. rotundata]
MTTLSKLNGSGRNGQICTLCEDFASQTLSYLSDNETQIMIINGLHHVCSKLYSLKHQCLELVDYYVPMFFVMVSQIQPKEFCEEVKLCEIMTSLRLPNHDGPCKICHNLVVEVLTKLTDPDIQLEIIEVLLKACSKMDNYAQECKKIAFHYGPLILFDIEISGDNGRLCCYSSNELDVVIVNVTQNVPQLISVCGQSSCVVGE